MFFSLSRWLISMTAHSTSLHLFLVLQQDPEKLLPTCMPYPHYCKWGFTFCPKRGVKYILRNTLCWFLLQYSPPASSQPLPSFKATWVILITLGSFSQCVGVWGFSCFLVHRRWTIYFYFSVSLFGFEQLHRRERGECLHLVARNPFYSLEIFHILKSSCLPTLVKFCALIYK